MVKHEGIWKLNPALGRLKRYDKFAGVTIKSPNHAIPRNASMFDDVPLRPNSTCLSLTLTNVFSVMNKYVSDVLWVVSYLNGEIVEPSLFVVPSNCTVLVEQSIDFQGTLRLVGSRWAVAQHH